MTKETAMVRGSRGLAEAFNYMKKDRVDQLFVRDREGALVGMVTLELIEKHYDDESKTVADVMQTEIKHTVNPTTSLTEVAGLLSQQDVFTLPVIDDGKLVGVVTRTSMIRGIAEVNHQEGGEG
ncbi:CBS domain protein AcuB [Geomicrobium sp. JCM 19039]|nr:CBS domain protein AcuB [Geomicrobium sp. JCM 19039]